MKEDDHMEKTLTNKEYLQEILEILREQQRREDANLLYELCAHIESMENKIDMLEKELEQVTVQMSMLHGGGMVQKTKEMAQTVSENLNEQYRTLKFEVQEIKQNTADTIKSILVAVKQKGVQALDRIVEFTKFKDKLLKLRERMKTNIKKVNDTIDKITDFTATVRSANQQVKNATRTLVGKEEKDYSKQTQNSRMTELLTMPWRVQRGLLAGIDMHVESLLGIVARIEKSAEKSKEPGKEATEEKNEVEHVVGEVVEASAVAEECKYGLDAFDDYVKQNGTEGLEERLGQKGEGAKVR